MDSEHLLDDLAGAVLDGETVDWTTAESSADTDVRSIVRRLRLLAAVGEVHRQAQTATDIGALPTRWAHLELHERIGRGAFGEVFRAWDARLDREVALKLLPAGPASPTDSQVIREGRLLAKVRHPNVVTIYGAEQIGDRVGLWMEFVRGRTLEQEIRDGRRFSCRDVIAIGIELCRAVSAVHAAGLLHRDIKAHNVTRADDGRIVLMDFGAGSDANDSSTAEVAGTPLYLAPEVLTGSAATIRSDVYSLGILLYHVVTGSYPVRGRTLREIRDAHERGGRVALRSARPDIWPGLARAIERACDPRPDRRYESVDALARELRRRRSVHTVLRSGLAAAAVLAVAWLGAEVRARVLGSPGPTGRAIVSMSQAAQAFFNDEPVIAVLPFRISRNAMGDPDDDLIVDSIAAGLVRELSVIDGLQVKSAASSFLLRNRPREHIISQLGVNHVVEGTAWMAFDKLNVEASLVSLPDNTVLKAERLTHQLESEADIAAVVADLSQSIVSALRLPLIRRTQRRYDTDLASLRLYLKARALRDAHGGTEAWGAIKLFEEVIRKDPSFAPAQTALATLYGILVDRFPSAETAKMATRMEPLIRGALEIDPMDPEAHSALGFVHALSRRWSESETSFRHALSIERSMTSIHSDFVMSTLMPWGRFDESQALLEEALSVDPASLDLRRVVGYTQLQVGRYREARDNLRAVLDVDSSYTLAEAHLRWALFFGGERNAALKMFEAFGASPDGSPSLIGRGWIEASHGRRAEAEAIAAKLERSPNRQAEIYGLLGDTDRALEALERFAQFNPIRAARFLNHPEIGLPQGDPRAAAFRRKLGFP